MRTKTIFQRESGRFTLIELLVACDEPTCPSKSRSAGRGGESPARGRRPIRSMFTLIELLVVIGIIAILASLLLPALQRAKDTSKSLACLNNVKQFALVHQSYVDDHSGGIPFVRWDAAFPNWIYEMNDWIPGFDYGKVSTGSKKAKLLTCPLIGRDATSLEWHSDYVLNQYAACQYTGVYPQASPVIYRNKLPSQTFLMYEFIKDYMLAYGNHPLMNSDHLEKCYRHNLNMNVSYLDGHAETKHVNSFQISDVSTTPWRSDKD